MHEDVHRIIAEYDASHPQECPVDKRRREIREIKSREARRQMEIQHQKAATNTQNWCNWVDERIAASLDAFLDKMLDVFAEVVSLERARAAKKVATAVEETKRWVEGKFETKIAVLEERLKATPSKEQQAADNQWRGEIDRRIKNLEQEIAERLGPDTLREDQREIEAKLEALEQRLKATPGRLPVARIWEPESITYQAEFVSHDGELWQARRDTAKPPGSEDWVCVARAGRNAKTPTVCGTYDSRKNYEALDIVAMEGATFIAKHGDPGICPGDDWQLMARQGKTGRPGAPGERGPRGDKGEKGEPGVSTTSWQIDRINYRVSPLMSDGKVGSMLELRGLFEQFLDEISIR